MYSLLLLMLFICDKTKNNVRKQMNTITFWLLIESSQTVSDNTLQGKNNIIWFLNEIETTNQSRSWRSQCLQTVKLSRRSENVRRIFGVAVTAGSG